jgi:hypothetical protein
MKNPIIYFLTLTLIAACIQADGSDVVVTAKNEGYTSFHDAVMSAGIYEHAKKNEGETGSLAPFTVFVPTNDALAAIKTLDAKKQKKYITYHVVPGKKIEKPDEAMKEGVGTVGEKLLFAASGEVYLDESKTKAKIIKGPIAASNGVLYVIDQVLLPAGEELPAPEKPTITPTPTAVTPTPPTPVVAATPAPAHTSTVAVTPTPIQLMMPIQTQPQETITEKTAQTLTATITQLTQSIQLLIHVIQQAQNPLEPTPQTDKAPTTTTPATKPPVVVA